MIKTKQQSNFPDGNFCKPQSAEHGLVKSHLQNLHLAKKTQFPISCIKQLPISHRQTTNKCAWSRPSPVSTVNTSSDNWEVRFDVPSVTVGSDLRVWTAWCRFVHHRLGCWLVYVTVPARLTHCYENTRASHSEQVYIWLCRLELNHDPEPNADIVTHITVQRWCGSAPVTGWNVTKALFSWGWFESDSLT